MLTSESYDESADLWSLGVIIYTLLSGKCLAAALAHVVDHSQGYPPFYADNAPALFKRIMDVKVMEAQFCDVGCGFTHCRSV